MDLEIFHSDQNDQGCQPRMCVNCHQHLHDLEVGFVSPEGKKICSKCVGSSRNPTICRVCFKFQWSSNQLFQGHLYFHPDHQIDPWEACPLCKITIPKLLNQENQAQMIPLIQKPSNIHLRNSKMDLHVRKCILRYLTDQANFKYILPKPIHLEHRFPYLFKNFEEILINMDLDPQTYLKYVESHQNQGKRKTQTQERPLFNSQFLQPFTSQSFTSQPFTSQPFINQQTFNSQPEQVPKNPFSGMMIALSQPEVVQNPDDDLDDLLVSSMKRLKI